MVPLVFKTSLGIVRFPEGSTPSLLRQISCINSAGNISFRSAHVSVIKAAMSNDRNPLLPNKSQLACGESCHQSRSLFEDEFRFLPRRN